MSIEYDKLQKEIMDSILPMVSSMSEDAIKTMINDMASLPQEFRESIIKQLLDYKASQK